MSLIFRLKKRALEVKLKKASKKAKELAKARKLEARRERELMKLKNEIKRASQVKLSKSDKAILKSKAKSRKESFAKLKSNALKVGKEGVSFAIKLGKYIDKNVARGVPKRKKKRYY